MPRNKIAHLEDKFAVARFGLINSCDDSEMRLYLFLKLHAISKSTCFPRWETILTTLKWSREKLNRTIKRMEDLGHLIITREEGHSNVYDITWYDQINVTQSRNETTQSPIKLSTDSYPQAVSKRDHKQSRNETTSSLETRPERLRTNEKKNNDNTKGNTIASERRYGKPQHIGQLIQQKMSSL